MTSLSSPSLSSQMCESYISPMAMQHFSRLPEEIIVHIFRFLLASKENCLAMYSRLHSVCRRWHNVCVNWAEHLPKYNRPCDLIIVEGGCTSQDSHWRRRPICTNLTGSGVGPELAVLLRHYAKTAVVELFFDSEKLICTDSLLLQLTQLFKVQLTKVYWIEFGYCDMSGVSEEVLETFFAAVAESKCCNELRIGDVKSAGVFTDRALAPIISSGILKFIIFKGSKTSTTAFGITDQTLANFAKNFAQKGFTFYLGNNVKNITAEGVFHLMQAYFSSDCSLNQTFQICVPVALKSDLLNLVAAEPLTEAQVLLDNHSIIHKLSLKLLRYKYIILLFATD